MFILFSQMISPTVNNSVIFLICHGSMPGVTVGGGGAGFFRRKNVGTQTPAP